MSEELNYNINNDNETSVPLGTDDQGNTISCTSSFPRSASKYIKKIPDNVREEFIKDQDKIKERVLNSRSSGPPYVTYEDDELIYIPLIFHVVVKEYGESYDSFSDQDLFNMVELVNNMFAGTYEHKYGEPDGYGGSVTPNVPNALNHIGHGVDSGIRFKLVHKIPKSLLNPLFQESFIIFNHDHAVEQANELQIPESNIGESTSWMGEGAGEFTLKHLSSRFFDELYGFDSAHSSSTDGGYKSASLFNISEKYTVTDLNPYFVHNMTAEHLCNQNATVTWSTTAIANLSEGVSEEEYFTTGRYGAIFRYALDKCGVTESDQEQISFVIHSLNLKDSGQSFADGTVYNNIMDGYNMGGYTSASYQYYKNMMHKDGSSFMTKHSFKGITNFVNRLPVINVLFPGNNDLSYAKAEFPFPPNEFQLRSANNMVVMNNPPIKQTKEDPYFVSTAVGNFHSIRNSAETLAHELGHTLGLLHTQESAYNDRKDKLLPFLNTKKSWFRNADSFIPPFNYTDRFGQEQNYKDISEDEKLYLQMLFDKVPKDITNNYTSKIIFNTGSVDQDFFLTHTYNEYFPEKLNLEHFDYINASSSAQDQQYWSAVLNKYLSMTLNVDSLWGDSYILLDDNSNNTSIANGGKPVYVVNPTLDLVDGILLSGVHSTPTINSVEEVALPSYEDFKNVLDLGDYSNPILHRPELGGFVVRAAVSEGDKILYIFPDLPLESLSDGGINRFDAQTLIDNFSYGGFDDWIMPDGSSLQKLRLFLIGAFDGDEYRYYDEDVNIWQTNTCADLNSNITSVAAILSEVGNTCNTAFYAGNGTTVITSPYSTSYSLSSWEENNYDLSPAGTLFKAFPLRKLTYNTPHTIEQEFIPANRKGPAITSRVPFCVPNEDGTPSNVFDPFWFANINWRDPKNRAYPENWPVTKLYDEFDSEGAPLCPCLYAEQSYYRDGQLVTYTPINAYRTGYGPGHASSIDAANMSDSYPVSADAEALRFICRNIPLEYAAPNYMIFYPAAINTSDIYINPTGIHINDSLESFPSNANLRYLVAEGFQGVASLGFSGPDEYWNSAPLYKIPSGGGMISYFSSSSSYISNTYDSLGNVVKEMGIYNSAAPGTFSGGIEGGQPYITIPGEPYHHDGGPNKYSYLGNRYGFVGFPHAYDFYFNNTPFGWKPYPGGYSTDEYESTDPIHHMELPIGIGYVGKFAYGPGYANFKVDWQAADQENGRSGNTLGYTGDSVGSYGTFQQGSTLTGNFIEDIPSMFQNFNFMNDSKFLFGSDNPASPYYNPYTINVLEEMDDYNTTVSGNGNSWQGGMKKQLLFHGYILPEGQTFQEIESPKWGIANPGNLTNIMGYSDNAIVTIKSDTVQSFVYHAKGFYNSHCCASAFNPASSHTSGKTAFSPDQISLMRANILGNQGHLLVAKEFGDKIELRTGEYFETNTARDHITYCQNKVYNAWQDGTYSSILTPLQENGYGNLTLYNMPTIISPEINCSNGNCNQSTAFEVCADTNEFVCNGVSSLLQIINNTQFDRDVWENVEELYEAFLNLIPDLENGETAGPKFICPENPEHGCYYIHNASLCTEGEFIPGDVFEEGCIVSSDNQIVNAEIFNSPGTYAGCDNGYNLPTLSIGFGLLHIAHYNYTEQGNRRQENKGVFVQDGYMISPTGGKLFLYNRKFIEKDELLSSAKKFEKILINLRKILSFAK